MRIRNPIAFAIAFALALAAVPAASAGVVDTYRDARSTVDEHVPRDGGEDASSEGGAEQAGNETQPGPGGGNSSSGENESNRGGIVIYGSITIETDDGTPGIEGHGGIDGLPVRAPEDTDPRALIDVDNKSDDPIDSYIPIWAPRDGCSFGHGSARQQGAVNEQGDSRKPNHELDPLKAARSCAELRDATQEEIYEQTGAPPVHYCKDVNNLRFCAGLFQQDCDVALVGGGLIRVCAGGLNPRN